MKRSLLDVLVDPISLTPLELDGGADDIEEGQLRGGDGRTYPVRGGIPRLVVGSDPAQRQTGESFAYKWARRESWGSEGMRALLAEWLPERYGFESPAGMRAWFAAQSRTLDVGCGAGQATSVWLERGWSDGGAEWVGVDISDAIDVARERLGGIERTHFVQADVLALPFAPESFDAIIAEGVLHHTPSTREALARLVPLLRPGAAVLFYVYRRKPPVREFTDDYVRARLADLSPDEAWDALRPLTALGRALAELEAEVEVPEDIPVLGIEAGRYDVQRLVYWNFAKLFWNPELSFEENVHVNFDWYAPAYAHRHTEDEVRGWCRETGLEISHFGVQPSGFTVRAVKASS